MTPEIARAIARAVPPLERLGSQCFSFTIDGDEASRRRRADAWIAAVGGEPEHRRRLQEIGLDWDDWCRSLGPVELRSPVALPDWAHAGTSVFSRLLDAEDRGGDITDGYRAVRDLARADLLAIGPAGLDVDEAAITSLIDWLAAKFGAAFQPTLASETQIAGRPFRSWRDRLDHSPVLLYLFGTAYADWLAAARELLARGHADRELIAARFFEGRPLGRVLAIEPALGDPHNGGRSVAIVTYEAGRVVYKPKDLRIITAVEACARLLSTRTGLQMPVPRTEHRDGYAWQECVSSGRIVDLAGAAQFWRNLGGWLGLLQLLAANDFWFDNLLADGPLPRFIDFETAMQPGFAPARTSRDAVERYLLSPLSIGILPMEFAIGEGHDPTDLACLARPGDHRTPLRDDAVGGRQSWFEDRFVPRLASGDYAGRADGLAHVLDGYETALTSYRDAAFRHELEGAIAAGAGLVRHIRIDTWSCYRVIRMSVRPRFLADGVWREIALRGALARRSDLLGAIGEAAIHDLRRQDVPLFQCAANGTDIIGSAGECGRNAFEVSPIDYARWRLGRLGGIDVASQLELVKSACASIAAPAAVPRIDAQKATTVTRADVLEWTREIGQLIADVALDDRDGSPTWIARVQDPFTGVCAVRPVGLDLLIGRAGIALALMEAGLATGTPAWTRLAADALVGCASSQQKIEWLSLGGVGIAGAGGVVYALARAGEALQESRLRALAESLVDTIHVRQLWRGQGDDAIAGRAGLIGCLRASRLSNDATARLIEAVTSGDSALLGRGHRYAPSADILLTRIGENQLRVPEPVPTSLALIDALWVAGETGDEQNCLDTCGELAVARGATGAWLADRAAADRHELSAITGLSALAMAFARTATGRLPFSAPRRLAAEID